MTDPAISLQPALPESRPAVPRPTSEMRAAAREFEAVFLAEMLRHAGLGAARESFGGGAGEAQFAPLLARAQADAMAEAGGLGLADRIAEALAARTGR